MSDALVDQSSAQKRRRALHALAAIVIVADLYLLSLNTEAAQLANAITSTIQNQISPQSNDCFCGDLNKVAGNVVNSN